MSKVITFGEILMRLSTEKGARFTQTNSFELCFGGGEFNVAASLANFGIDVGFVTCLPNNDLGKRALMEIRKQNVSADNIIFSGDRLGIYFLEEGSSIRGSQVIYDRAESAISRIKTGMIDWKSIFKNVDVFHFSGITPAISTTAAEVCLEAVKYAHKAGITISCDLNYRAKLWQYGKEPKHVMPKLLEYCNIILGDIDTALFMLGKNKINPDYQNIHSIDNPYTTIFECCPNLHLMATTLRYSITTNYQQIGGILYDKKDIYTTHIREVTPVIDRIGTGDAFMSGLLYCILNQSFNSQQTLDFAVEACCLKHTIKGDLNQVNVEDVLKLMNGENSGKVSR